MQRQPPGKLDSTCGQRVPLLASGIMYIRHGAHGRFENVSKEMTCESVEDLNMIREITFHGLCNTCDKIAHSHTNGSRQIL